MMDGDVVESKLESQRERSSMHIPFWTRALTWRRTLQTSPGRHRCYERPECRHLHTLHCPESFHLIIIIRGKVSINSVPPSCHVNACTKSFRPHRIQGDHHATAHGACHIPSTQFCFLNSSRFIIKPPRSGQQTMSNHTNSAATGAESLPLPNNLHSASGTGPSAGPRLINMANGLKKRFSRNSASPSQPGSASQGPKWWKIRLFRGMINDVRRRAPYYLSDWIDAWDYRVIPATIYMYFAKYECPQRFLPHHQLCPFILQLSASPYKYQLRHTLLATCALEATSSVSWLPSKYARTLAYRTTASFLH